MTPAEKQRVFLVELRRGLGIILRAAVECFGVSYLDLLPREVISAAGLASWSEPTATVAGTWERG